MIPRALILGALASGLVLTAARAEDAEEARLRARVAQFKGADPTNWRKIPWVVSVLEARRLSREEEKPVFLFSHDGNMETGRC